MERCTVKDRLDQLTDVYTCLQTGSCSSRSSAEMARVIFSGVCEPSDGDGDGYCHDSNMELTYISVTVVGKIAFCLTTQSLQPEVASYFSEILKVLFEDMDLMSQLVHQFQAEDQIISHLAAKSASAYVLCHLYQSHAVSPVWEQKCLQAFHSSAPGTELDACLWSLTEVLKGLLKGANRDVFGKLLAAFDSSLSELCSKLLPGEGNETAPRLMACNSSRHRGTTFCLLMDLLEVLTASSLIFVTGVCLRSQRLTHIHSSALLRMISSSSSEGFVKKRALLLLKRAVLQKAGEDYALGDTAITGPKHEHSSDDVSMLTQSVLTAVGANWLESVQVDSAAFFGGTRHGGDAAQKPDCVMLRAVSLLLIKSIELNIQTAGGTGVASHTEVYGYLNRLWVFLKRNSTQLMETTHLCGWVSMIFGEQDDDMIEAAKALLLIFLYHRQCSGLDGANLLEAACGSGCNPHCHFVILLQSISFDHSVLLDFLISTETCFLDYFVRYLKYLRSDWQSFSAACRQRGASGSRLSSTRCELRQVEFSPCGQATGVVSPVGINSAVAGLRLVEYASSEESDSESMDYQEQREKNKFSTLGVKQEIREPPVSTRLPHLEASPHAGIQSQPSTALEKGPEGPFPPALQSGQTSRPNITTLSKHLKCDASTRAAECLSELREVVMRLQARELFPYNPSSLIKLLAQVENCSKQLQFNK